MLEIAADAALIIGLIVLLTFKDVEQSGIDDPRRTWWLNGGLALICATYVWSGDAAPPPGTGSSLGAMVAWTMAVIWIGHALYFLRFVERPTPASDQLQLHSRSLAISTTALIALLEELVFRGWLQSAIYPTFSAVDGIIYGVFAVNLLFALMHYGRGFTFALSAGFVGMIFSVVTLASGSLWPAIVMHVSWNCLIGLARTRPHEVVEEGS